MTAQQSDIRAALLNPLTPTPSGMTNPDGSQAGKRFDVYRNNVTHSLTQALATAFPLVQKLIGTAKFTNLARLYARAHPPSSPLMMYYGERLPAFLEHFDPVSHIGYLPDCARLDLALRQSYHAADCAPLDPDVFQVPAEELASLHLAPAPSTITLHSRWPLYDIWAYSMVDGAPKPQAVAQDVLIARPDYDPIVLLLPAGAVTWLEALCAGQTLGQAQETATAAEPEFDLSASLTVALAHNALVLPTSKDTL